MTVDIDEMAFEVYRLAVGYGEDEGVKEFKDAYCGVWESEEAYARNLADELGLVSENTAWPATCIDWEHATRELFYDYFSVDCPGGVCVFRNV